MTRKATVGREGEGGEGGGARGRGRGEGGVCYLQV